MAAAKALGASVNTSLRLHLTRMGSARGLNLGLRLHHTPVRKNLRQFSILSSNTRCNLYNLEPDQKFAYLSSTRHQSSAAATKVILKDSEESLVLQLADGSTIEYSYLWLRDCCLCPECCELSSNQRIIILPNLPVDCKPGDVKIDDTTVTITWDDGHVSPFPLNWLVERGHTPENIQRRMKLWPLPAKSWGHELLDDLPTDSFQNLMKDDRALLNWICNIEKLGFFLIKDAPKENGTLEKFAERIAFLRWSNYGPIYTVKSKPDPSNAVFTPSALGLHTDQTFYYYTAGVQMLHCIIQATKGGENQFADGFYGAEIVKKLRPDYYKILCSTLVEFHDVGTDFYKFHKFTRRPIFQFDTMGNLNQVSFSSQMRDYFSHLLAKEMTALYKAMKFYDSIMCQPENHIEIKLKEGEIACFHNYRVMHARRGFEFTGSSKDRHLEGGYLNWDEVHSRRRVLQQELNL